MKIKKSTKALAAAASLAMMATVGLSACGGSDSSETDADGKPVIRIALIKRSTQIEAKEMKLQKDLEAACDCTIKWDEILDTQWAQQSSTVLASGDVADITIWGYNSDNFAQYDYWEDLSDDLDQMPNVKAYFKEVPNAEKFGSDIDGHVWQVPSDYGNASGAKWSSGQNLMINKSWLEKLGLGVPKTWDDLTKVLTAFKNDDPNGNGEADEIPMLINQLGTAGFNWWDPFLLLNGTGLNTQVISTAGSKGIYVKDGKIGNFMITDNFRQVIEYYHSLIEKGLMPKDILTRDGSQNTADISNDGKTAKVGLVFGWNTGNFGDLKDQYESIEFRQLRASPMRKPLGNRSSKISTTALASRLIWTKPTRPQLSRSSTSGSPLTCPWNPTTAISIPTSPTRATASTTCSSSRTISPPSVWQTVV